MTKNAVGSVTPEQLARMRAVRAKAEGDSAAGMSTGEQLNRANRLVTDAQIYAMATQAVQQIQEEQDYIWSCDPKVDYEKSPELASEMLRNVIARYLRAATWGEQDAYSPRMNEWQDASLANL